MTPGSYHFRWSKIARLRTAFCLMMLSIIQRVFCLWNQLIYNYGSRSSCQLPRQWLEQNQLVWNWLIFRRLIQQNPDFIVAQFKSLSQQNGMPKRVCGQLAWIQRTVRQRKRNRRSTARCSLKCSKTDAPTSRFSSIAISPMQLWCGRAPVVSLRMPCSRVKPWLNSPFEGLLLSFAKSEVNSNL